MSNIELNKKMYGRRIEQLDHILKDNTFLTDGGYREFVVSMYKALTSGRKITPKMESAIINSVTKCKNSPVYNEELREEADDLTGDPHAYIKIMNIVFPSNKKGDGESASPRERMERIRSSEQLDILNPKVFDNLLKCNFKSASDWISDLRFTFIS